MKLSPDGGPPTSGGGNGHGLVGAPVEGAATPWLLALLGWTILLCSVGLAGGAYFEPIDCWVAQTAREMRAAGDWLVPRFSGEVRMQKSPGPYWAVMLTSLARGTPVDEVSARLPSVVAAVLLVATVFWLTRRIAGVRAAVYGGFAMSASVLILWWSRRAASDLGLAACTTVSLAALWIGSECVPAGRRRVAYWLLGYFMAGVGMLYKMPMPLVVVGLPAVCYVLLLRRWSILASGWHLVGLLVFLLPWLPWAVAVFWAEDAALTKWKVEFIDRFTGSLPNVQGQDNWRYLCTYLGPPLLYCLPFTLSLPGALWRAFRRQPGVERRGTLFMVIWIASLLVFFTASTGKEWRYFLPALPPFFVLLGIELAAFFDPARRATPRRDLAGAVAVWVLTPTVLFGGAFWGLRRWFEKRGQYELADLYTWTDVWQAYAVAAAILVAGFSLAAWLYLRRREQLSFAAIVATMWLMWLWSWPQVMPLLMSQRPFRDFAAQLNEQIPAELRPHLRQLGSQDSRIVWYGDVRLPRLIDQLDLLREQGHERSLEYELRRYGEEMVRQLSGSEPVLFVASLLDYVHFLISAPEELARQGRALPPQHLWLQTRYGDYGRHFVVFGNVPPPYPEPQLRVPERQRARIEAAAEAARIEPVGAQPGEDG